MAYQTVEIEARESIATVWMNRPDRHNAFDETLIRELTDAVNATANDASIRVIVLAGRGKSFSAGADLDWMRRAAGATFEQNRDDARTLALLFDTLHRAPKPTIARVQGAALGGGLGLTAVCDIAVASANATFATTEVRLGLLPAVISPYVIAAIGERAARRYFLTAERIDAPQAHRLGLVHAVGSSEAAMDETIAQLAASIIAGAPGAQHATKDLIRTIVSRPIDGALLEDTADRIATARTGSEAKEGITAFFERRPPNWKC